MSYNISELQLEGFGPESHPTMRVIDAIRASTSVPIGFTPWQSTNGNLFVDGAIHTSYPIAIAKEIHGMISSSDHNGLVMGSAIHPRPKNEPISSFVDYLHRLFSICTDKNVEFAENTMEHYVDMPTTLEICAVPCRRSPYARTGLRQDHSMAFH